MGKLLGLLEEVNKELETAKELNPQMAMGMNVIKEMIVNRLQTELEGATEGVITLIVDNDVVKMLSTFGQALENFKDGMGGRLNEYMTRTEELEQYKRKPRQIPAEFSRIIAPERLDEVMVDLQVSINELITKGEAKEAAYGPKPDLLRQKAQLETAVKLTEAEAMGKIQGEGKSQYVVIAGEKMFLTNDQTRDAYRRTASKAEREALATVNGELGAQDVAIFRATDGWYTAKEAADKVQAKANLQAALLNFLAGGR